MSTPSKLLLSLAIALFTSACGSPGGGEYVVLPQCTNGEQDPDEEGVDCGGPCPRCSLVTCNNGVRDPNETDLDCGGPCQACGEGKACNVAGDCTTGNCVSGFCGARASCDDGEKNGNETDLDCGGNCAGCGAGRACQTASDCLSDACTGNVCSEPASCKDGLKSPDESDTDCGGPCRACATGRFCDVDVDCISVVCVNGVCRDPSCSDARKNQNESDVDCGGVCPSCNDGLRCGAPEDCKSGKCAGGRCVSCTDGIQNGDESGIDCGGSCGPCQDGGPCNGDGDCATGKCDRGFCCVPNACGDCAALPVEVCDGIDNDCDGQTDEELGMGPACEKNTGVCIGARATCRGTAGWTCQDSDYRANSASYQANETSCDGLDNDCDGQTDEGVTNACGACGPVPTEVCDNIDNDCDGQTDEGVTNACGTCGPVPTEICDRIDNDCDGQTDEIAACQACMTTPVTFRSSTGSGGNYRLNPGTFMLLDDQTPVALLDDGYSFSLKRFGATMTNITSDISGENARAVRIGNDFLVVYKASSDWKAQRFNANGVSQQTWNNLMPITYQVKSFVSSGTEALWVASGSNFSGGSNPSILYERHYSGGNWAASTEIDEGRFDAVGLLVGGTRVRLYEKSDGSSWLKSKWGTGAATNIVADTFGFEAAAHDGKVHMVTGYPLQHWVGTATSWTQSSPSNAANMSAAMLSFLPTGEPVAVSGYDEVKFAVLRNNRWQIKTLVPPASGDQRINDATFIVDAHGRTHILYSGTGSGIETTWTRGITVCTPL